ncbi:calcium-binding protein [Jannaschia marina]|uniref:calcium-binding protein n=1 Tax=Jannaschia marina TaxID=2741674 RepID=UPI0015CEECB2|nr:calcium-binding protein [Jannaschia marina]
MDNHHHHNHDHNHHGTDFTYVANNYYGGQIHTFFGGLRDHSENNLTLSFSGIYAASGGHHIRTGGGHDSINFANLDEVQNVVVGRIEDLDYSRDHFMIEGVYLDLTDLPDNARIVEWNGDHNDSGADPQQWLLIETSGGGYVFYTLEGARIDMTGDGGANSGTQERHFVRDLPTDFADLESVEYIDQQNIVPYGYVPLGGVIINDVDTSASDVLSEIQGSNGGDLIAAGLNDDIVDAGDGQDQVWGGSGHDEISSGNGADTVFGGTGNDRIDGEDGDDHLFGEHGDDWLSGNAGNDLIDGGFGNDQMFGHSGADSMFGGTGHDDLFGGGGNDLIAGNHGDDNLTGGGGDDRIFGGGGDDTLNGGIGDDVMNGGYHDDLLLGRDGSDLVRGGAGEDRLYGGVGNDVLAGNAGDDSIEGGSGNDRIFGGVGDDVVVGGRGRDELHGGLGSDVFEFRDESHSLHGANRDTILDFESGVDVINLSGLMDELTFVEHYTNSAGEVRYDGDIGRLHIDTDGDGISDFSIDLIGTPTVGQEDLIL